MGGVFGPGSRNSDFKVPRESNVMMREAEKRLRLIVNYLWRPGAIEEESGEVGVYQGVSRRRLHWRRQHYDSGLSSIIRVTRDGDEASFCGNRWLSRSRIGADELEPFAAYKTSRE